MWQGWLGRLIILFSRNHLSAFSKLLYKSASELTSPPLNGSEKDNDTRYGFFILLCYRSE